MFLSPDLHETYTRRWSHKMLVTRFQVKCSKVKVTGVIRIFCRVRSVVPCLFDWSALHLTQMQSSRWHRWFEIKVMLVIRSFCRFRSLTSSFFDRITPYVVCIKHRRGQCAAHNFQDESSKVKVEVSTLSTWYNTWMGDVSCYFSAGRD